MVLSWGSDIRVAWQHPWCTNSPRCANYAPRQAVHVNSWSGFVTIKPVCVSPQNPQVRNRNRRNRRKTTRVAKGQWYPRRIIRLMHRSRNRDALELSQQLQAPENKRKRYEYCICKTGHPVSLMVQCHQCKDWFHPTWGSRGVVNMLLPWLHSGSRVGFGI